MQRPLNKHNIADDVVGGEEEAADGHTAAAEIQRYAKKSAVKLCCRSSAFFQEIRGPEKRQAHMSITSRSDNPRGGTAGTDSTSIKVNTPDTFHGDRRKPLWPSATCTYDSTLNAWQAQKQR
jgi:hypothetical protein